VKTATSEPGWVLAADAVMKVDGKWGGGRDSAFKGMPPHQGLGKKPIGSNHLTLDGAARWVQVQKLLFLHSWNTGGARDSYMFQDDIGPELQAKVAQIRLKL
jgi:hypothetical protein